MAWRLKFLSKIITWIFKLILKIITSRMITWSLLGGSEVARLDVAVVGAECETEQPIHRALAVSARSDPEVDNLFGVAADHERAESHLEPIRPPRVLEYARDEPFEVVVVLLGRVVVSGH